MRSMHSTWRRRSSSKKSRSSRRKTSPATNASRGIRYSERLHTLNLPCGSLPRTPVSLTLSGRDTVVTLTINRAAKPARTRGRMQSLRALASRTKIWLTRTTIRALAAANPQAAERRAVLGRKKAAQTRREGRVAEARARLAHLHEAREPQMVWKLPWRMWPRVWVWGQRAPITTEDYLAHLPQLRALTPRLSWNRSEQTLSRASTSFTAATGSRRRRRS